MPLQPTMMDEEERQRLLQSIPKMQDFEHNLENIQPLKGGRRAHTLATLSQQTNDDRQHMIESEKERFEDELKHLDELDDPLDVYLRYLQWTHETFPSGNSRESGLVKLLERTVFAFATDTQYASDARYLRCWLEYAKWVDTKKVFVQLAKKNIGKNLALYYEQYSLFYEGQEQYDKARFVLERGLEIQQKANKSTTRLEKYLHEFEKRVKHKQQQQQQQQQQQRSTSAQHSGERTMLGHKLHSRDTQSMSQTTFNNRQNTPGFYSNGSLSSSTTKRSFGNATTSTPTTQQGSTTKLQVFRDSPIESTSSTSPSSSNRLSQSTSSSSPSSSSLDTVFPSTIASASRNVDSINFSKNRQENTVPVECFSGARLPQKSDLVTRPSIPKIEVFRDDASPPPPEHLNQMKIDNNNNYSSSSSHGIRDTSSIHHRPSTMATIPTDRQHSHQRHDKNNTRLSKPTFTSQLPDDGFLYPGELHDILNRRYLNMKDDYIEKHNEVVAALVDCLGPPGPIKRISFEELRAGRQVNRKGEPQIINAKVPTSASLLPAPSNTTVIPYLVGQGLQLTMENTTETQRAQESIGALLKRKDDDDDGSDDDDGNDDDDITQMKRMRRTYVDENS